MTAKPIDQVVETVMQVQPTPPIKAITPAKFEKFQVWLGLKTFNDPALECLVESSYEWFESYRKKESPRWLSLVGSSGTGKTHAAKRLWKWAKANADWSTTVYQPHLIYWPEYVQRLRAGEYDYRNDIRTWPVLFLDDVGSERDPTGFAVNELNSLLDHRLHKWTIITSNLDMEGMEILDKRIASRMIRDRNIATDIRTLDYATR